MKELEWEWKQRAANSVLLNAHSAPSSFSNSINNAAPILYLLPPAAPAEFNHLTHVTTLLCHWRHIKQVISILLYEFWFIKGMIY